MGDSQFTGLVALTPAQQLALLATLQLAIDDPSFADALKIPLTQLLSSSVVPETAQDTFTALTPKGFNASRAGDAVHGIVRNAMNSDIDDKGVTNPNYMIPVGRMTRMMQSMTTDLVHIQTADIATYFDNAAGNFVVSSCDLHVKQIGNIVFIHGEINGSWSFITGEMNIYMKGLPLPINGLKQAFAMSIKIYADLTRPLGASVNYIDATKFRINGSGISHDLIQYGPIFFGGSYIIA